MASGNQSPENKGHSQKTQIKKTYEKPSFRFEQVFETQALSCGKVFATQGPCHSNRKTS
jgi:hypothetical protein